MARVHATPLKIRAGLFRKPRAWICIDMATLANVQGIFTISDREGIMPDRSWPKYQVCHYQSTHCEQAHGQRGICQKADILIVAALCQAGIKRPAKETASCKQDLDGSGGRPDYLYSMVYLHMGTDMQEF